MTETPQSTPNKDLQAALIQLQDDFTKAYLSQDLLEEVPVEALPDEYRTNIRLRQDKNYLYIAFSDDPKNLEPNEVGYVPNAHIKRISAVTGPRRTGSSIKEWVDAIREEAEKQK